MFVFPSLVESNNKGFNWVVGPDYNSDRGGIISYRGGQPLLGSKWKYWNSVVDGKDSDWAYDSKLTIKGCIINASMFIPYISHLKVGNPRILKK